jgi:hypothetical protein
MESLVIRAVVVRLVLCLCLLVVVVAGLGAFAFRDFRPQAMTIGQQVFFFQDPDEVANWMGLNAHENVHRSQYREHGLAGFLRDYILDPERRLRWEIEAHQADLCYRTLTHANPPRIAWEDEARQMARYVSASSDLTLEYIRGQMERELSPAFCRSLLAGIGVDELPRAEFPADGGFYPLDTCWCAVAQHVIPEWRMRTPGSGSRPQRSGGGNAQWWSASGAMAAEWMALRRSGGPARRGLAAHAGTPTHLRGVGTRKVGQ